MFIEEVFVKMLLISEQEQDKQLDTLLQMYHQGFTQTQIADKLNTSQDKVCRVLQKLGLPKKRHSRKGEVRPQRYKKFLFCKHCKWIPIKDISKKCYCPKCNGKLRTSRKSKNKDEVKRL